MNRVTLIVMDSLGVGQLPDAANYGDLGADTLGHINERWGGLQIPNLRQLGMGNIADVAGGKLRISQTPAGSFGKLAEKSRGKDTITGHWEICGLYTDIPFKTYPDGFPGEFISRFEQEIGRKVLANKTASGTEIIKELGAEHEKTGYPIVYTSADSVFQIAVNIEVIPLEELYKICETARRLLQGDWACGRVIARPYVKEGEVRTRTSDRKDYAVSPSGFTLLDKVKETGKTVYAIGKINDIFNGQGVTESVHTTDNMDGVDQTIEALKKSFEGLIFTNLVDFDSLYGHRRDPEGYARAIEEFDSRLPQIMEEMTAEDVLILCADHGNDPVHSGWDHTREYVPVIIYGDQIKAGVDLGIRNSFADIGATVSAILGAKPTEIGESFLHLIEK